MKLTSQGVIFDDYKRASPSTAYSRFTDEDGATLLIRTTTLVRMYEIVKYDLERRGTWEYLLKEIKEGEHGCRYSLERIFQQPQ